MRHHFKFNIRRQRPNDVKAATKRFVYRFIVPIPIFLFLTMLDIGKFNQIFAEKDCRNYYRIINLELKGIVTQKGQTRRGCEILWMKKSSTTTETIICGSSELKKMYELINIGDTVIKEKGVLTFTINDQLYDIFTFDCNENTPYIDF